MRLERARGDARVMIVVNANPVLVFGCAVGAQGFLARDLPIEVGEEGVDERPSHDRLRLVGCLVLRSERRALRGMRQERSHTVEDLVGQGTLGHLWKTRCRGGVH